LPATAAEALRIPVTVSQAELQEVRNNAFNLDSGVAEISPAGRVREPVVQHTGAKPATVSGNPRRKSGQASQRRPDRRASTSNSQARDSVQCFECKGFGHFARDCANRTQRRADSRATRDNGNKTGQGEVSEPSTRDRAKKVDGQRGNKSPLN